MEKKINKKKDSILEAQHERARKKVLYDSQMIILEGQRTAVKELEKKSETLLDDFIKSDQDVKKLMDELSELTQELANELDEK